MHCKRRRATRLENLEKTERRLELKSPVSLIINICLVSAHSSKKTHVDEEEVQRVLVGILEPCFEKFEKEYGSKILKEDAPEGFRSTS